MSIHSDSKTEKIVEIILEATTQKIKRVLVVGCGSGVEAAILAQKLKVDVVGIDIKNNFNKEANNYATLMVGNATHLNFPDATFDFVYSYHALEHIQTPVLALKEMDRVLKDKGIFFIGTPNKKRMLGYIGGKDLTLTQKIKWNYNDWRKRLKGRFENELGAHAGFYEKELEQLLLSVFQRADNVSNEYYMKLYEKQSAIISFLIGFKLSKFAFPSIYFMGLAGKTGQ